MPKHDDIDLSGVRFGRLTAVERAGSIRRNPAWRCRCDCGNEIVARRFHLIRGSTKSCGCSRSDCARHGHARGVARTSEFRIWESMRSRCRNPMNTAYKHYGGRGITVCERWQTFENFLADMGKRPLGKSLERVNNDGNYEKSNCRWASHKEQMRNRRTTKMIEWNGRTQSLVDWSDEIGISASVIHGRIRRGWEIEAALTSPQRIR
jgi:hypothetical protein